MLKYLAFIFGVLWVFVGLVWIFAYDLAIPRWLSVVMAYIISASMIVCSMALDQEDGMK